MNQASSVRGLLEPATGTFLGGAGFPGKNGRAMRLDPNLGLGAHPAIRVVAVLWLIACAIVIAPGGVVDQIQLADRRVKANQAQSPLGRTCFSCGNPAVSFADYEDRSRRYFCAVHPPPAKMQRTRAGDQGPPKFNPVFCYGILAIIFLTGTLRAFKQLISGGTRFQPTVLGGLGGVATAVLLWVWFSSVGT